MKRSLFIGSLALSSIVFTLATSAFPTKACASGCEKEFECTTCPGGEYGCDCPDGPCGWIKVA